MDIQKKDAIAAYGTQQALADALGISRTAVTMWPDDKPIPDVHALRLRYELQPGLFNKPRRARKQVAGNGSPLHGSASSRETTTIKTPRVKGAVNG